MDLAPVARDDETAAIRIIGRALKPRDAPRKAQVDARIARGLQERVQDRVRVVGRRKELARVLALEFDAVRLEKPHRVFDRELAQHRADCAGGAARVRLLVDSVVRDIAAPAARDEDLGADHARAVERDDARARAPGVDRREESRCASADDDEVCVLGVRRVCHGSVASSLTVVAMSRAFSAANATPTSAPAPPSTKNRT